MSTGERDCRHLCCDDRSNPFHDHFLPPEQCPVCERHRDDIAADSAPTDDPALTKYVADRHVERCESSECPCYWEGRHGRPRPPTGRTNHEPL